MLVGAEYRSSEYVFSGPLFAPSLVSSFSGVATTAVNAMGSRRPRQYQLGPLQHEHPMSGMLASRGVIAPQIKSAIPPQFLINQAAKDIVRKLLKINKSKRLGKAAGGASSVMKHKWYSGFDWEGLLKKQLEVPIEPKVRLTTPPPGFSRVSYLGEGTEVQEVSAVEPQTFPQRS